MPDWFDLLIKIGGLPFALVCLALYGGGRGWWIWGREVTRLEKDYGAQLVELRRDRDYYREIAFRALDRAEGAMSVAEGATTLAARRES